LVVLGVLLAACIDNTGGPPPPGEELEVETIEAPPLFCDSEGDRSAVLNDQNDVDAWLADCDDDGTGSKESLGQDLLTALSGLGSDSRLIAARIVGGGCVGGWDLMGIYLDGITFHPWVLKADTAHGRRDVACPADIWWEDGFWIAIGPSVAFGSEAELWVGVYNPNLGGGPALPGGG
jgi:hypothetical protein